MNAKKIAFLDRDGVINKKAPDHQYITKTSDFKFNRGIFSLLRYLKKEGYEFIVITNQRGIAKKILSEKTLAAIHGFMVNELKKRNIKILDIFYCPHDLDACDCRKPKPGLFNQACSKYPIDIKKSIILSDSQEDVIMGRKFGLGKSSLVETDKPVII